MTGVPASPGPEQAAADSAQHRALRPDALPTDTAVRFVLLVVTVSTASLYLFQAMWFAFRGKAFLETVTACLPTGPDRSNELFGIMSTEIQRQSACRAGVTREQVAYAIAGVALVLAIAWVAYRIRPAWRDRRSHLRPLDVEDGAALNAEVRDLAGAAGVAPPEVRVDAANPGVQAFAYGAGRDLRIGVTGGLVVQQVTDPAAFRAVIRHELGHLSNRDVPWTYYSVSVWWAFVVVALVPVVVTFAISDPRYVLLLGWRVAALAALVTVVGAGVLRVRESYADARAAEWGSAAALDRILAEQPSPRGRRPSWLRVHPSGLARRSLIADPDGLFRADWLTAITTGLAAGTAFAAVESVLSLVLPAQAAVVASAIPVGILVAAIVVVQAWRVALREAVRGGRYPLATPSGIGLGAGLAVAPVLTLQAAVGPFADGVAGWVGYLVWAGAMVLLTALVVSWVADTARLRVVAALSAPTPRSAVLVQGLVASLLLTLLLVAGSYSLLLLKTLGVDPSLDLPLTAVTGAAWLGSAPLVAAVAVALLALWTLTRLRRIGAPSGDRQDPQTRAWFWRDSAAPTGAPALPVAASGPLPRIGLVLVIGVAAGLTSGAAMVAARLLGGTRDDAVRGSDAFALVLGEGAQTSVIAVAIVATVVAAIIVPRAWWPVALLAGGAGVAVAGTLATATVVASGCGVLPTMHPGCSLPPWEQVDILLATAANEAAPPAFFLAALVGAIRWALPARQVTPAASPPARPRPTVAMAVVGTLVAVAVVAVWTGALAARVLQVEALRIEGTGYSVALPAEWQGRADPASGATLFVTIAEDVLISIQQAPSGSQRVDGDPVDVGGLTGWPIGLFEDGGAQFRVYEVEAPRGWHQVWVKGVPADLQNRQEEIGRLLAAVRWE